MAGRLLLLFCPLLLGLSNSPSFAQDFEQIGKSNPVKLSGGLSANQIFYANNAENTYRDPYNYYLGGQLTLDLYGVVLPFSFTYSNQQSQFRQPFNQFSLHPKYKWAQAHLGFTSASYSPYTLNGHIFEGAAFDLEPGSKWQLGLMIGRLQRAVQTDSSDVNAEIPAYERFGYAVMLKYGSQQNYIKFIMLKSEDNISSIQNTSDIITPEENLVASLSFSKLFAKRFLIQAEYSGSALTRDSRTEKVQNPTIPNLGSLYSPRTSSELYNAYNATLSYQQNAFNIGFRYEHVGPNYRTHGAYFFNNNFYNISLNTNFQLLSNKLSTVISLGLQEDNIDASKVSGTKRLVGSIGMGITASQKCQLNLAYSNYTTFTNINREYLDLAFLSPYERLDTLNYKQVSQNASVGLVLNIAQSSKSAQTFTSNLAMMETRSVQSDIEQPMSSIFITFNSTYIYSVLPNNLNLTGSLNIQKDIGTDISTTVLSPVVALGKAYFNKKLYANVALAFNSIVSTVTGNTINARLSARYALNKAHNFQLSVITVSRTKRAETITRNNELTTTLGYNYTF